MIITMEIGASPESIDRVRSEIEEHGLKSQQIIGEERTVFAVNVKLDTDKAQLKEHFEALPQVETVTLITKPYRIASKGYPCGKVTVSRQVKGQELKIVFNGANVITMAGPCSVENIEQMDQTAKFLSGLGVRVLRGGAYKPRTAPGLFEGLKEQGLKMLSEMREKYGMLIVTELMDVRDADLFGEYVDIIQIGTRNMQNFNLLEVAGSLNKPVFLKRGLANTIDEWLCAAERILLAQQVPQVILCERGIRTFETSTRNTFDLSALPNLAHESWLPVVADPSHATGRADLVARMTYAAIAAGANGIMIEVHPDPSKALTDGKQSVNFAQFEKIYELAKKYAAVEDKVLT